MSTTNSTNTSAKEQTPAVAWINPMRRGDGTLVREGAYVFTAKCDLTIHAGESLAVFQTKNGSYVVKDRTERRA